MDLISLPIEFNKKKFDGRYRLVIAAAKRAKALYQGAQPVVMSKAKKLTTLAMEEVLSDSIQVLTGEAAVKENEKAKKLTYEEMMDEAKQKEAIPEDLTEIEKDLKVYLHEKSERSGREGEGEFYSEEGSE